MNSTGIQIREALLQDAEAFLDLVEALAHYEKLAPPDREARERLVEHGFREPRRFDPYLALLDGEPVGYAITFETYSSFLARPTLYLEDLFVRPEARGRGVGTAMLRHLAREAVRRGCGRMDWVVLDWNELAQRTYRRIGAEQLDEWRLCRLAQDTLASFAAGEW